jgi:hypothetical protein
MMIVQQLDLINVSCKLRCNKVLVPNVLGAFQLQVQGVLCVMHAVVAGVSGV